MAFVDIDQAERADGRARRIEDGDAGVEADPPGVAVGPVRRAGDIFDDHGRRVGDDLAAGEIVEVRVADAETGGREEVEPVIRHVRHEDHRDIEHLLDEGDDAFEGGCGPWVEGRGESDARRRSRRRNHGRLAS